MKCTIGIVLPPNRFKELLYYSFWMAQVKELLVTFKTECSIALGYIRQCLDIKVILLQYLSPHLVSSVDLHDLTG